MTAIAEWTVIAATKRLRPISVNVVSSPIVTVTLPVALVPSEQMQTVTPLTSTAVPNKGILDVQLSRFHHWPTRQPLRCTTRSRHLRTRRGPRSMAQLGRTLRTVGQVGDPQVRIDQDRQRGCPADRLAAP